MTPTVFPWQQTQWQQLIAIAKADKLSHAWLLSGIAGLGKLQFAQTFAQTLLCEHGLELAAPCTVCRHCLWFKNASHPNLKLVQAEEKVIKIEQIRHLSATLVTKNGDNQRKIVILYPAEAMHSSAANALLKTLEEPVANCLLILVSHQAAMLPITIRSRCQHLIFKPTYAPETIAWLNQQLSQQQACANLLKLANGSPLQALLLAQNSALLQARALLLQQLLAIAKQQANPVQVAAQFLALPLDTVLVFLLDIVADILRLQQRLPQQFLIQQDSINLLQELMGYINLFKLFNFSDRLCQLRRKVQSHLNQQLALEDIFCEWCQVVYA